MNKQFVPGPAKLRNGNEAHISEEFEGRLYGRCIDSDGIWRSHDWYSNGRNYTYKECELDLMPNVEPEKVTFECTWFVKDYFMHPAGHGYHAPEFLLKHGGKRTRVEITVLDDESES